jgi:hypothetical protein
MRYGMWNTEIECGGISTLRMSMLPSSSGSKNLREDAATIHSQDDTVCGYDQPREGKKEILS